MTIKGETGSICISLLLVYKEGIEERIAVFEDFQNALVEGGCW